MNGETCIECGVLISGEAANAPLIGALCAECVAATARAQSPVAEGPLPLTFPPSANGFLLVDDRGTTHVAAWPAAYFVFVRSDDGEPHLGLIHCETLEDAQRRARYGGTILNSDFSPYEANARALVTRS